MELIWLHVRHLIVRIREATPPLLYVLLALVRTYLWNLFEVTYRLLLVSCFLASFIILALGSCYVPMAELWSIIGGFRMAWEN